MPQNQYDDDEFSFMTEHRRYLQKQEEEKLAEQAEKEKKIPKSSETQSAAKAHPPYGKPYGTDRKIKVPATTGTKGPNTKTKNNVKRTNTQQPTPEEIKRREEIRKKRIAQQKALEEKQKREREAKLKEEKERKASLRLKKEQEKKRYKTVKKENSKTYRNNMISVLTAYLICMVVVGAVLFAISYTAFRLIFAYNPSDSGDGYTYTIGKEEKYLKDDIACKNGNVYICGDDIASFCNLTVAGDESTVKYISPGKGNETASFIVGTRRAFVNKTEVRLTGETFFEKERFYIPVDFFQNYMQGVNIVHNALDRTVAVSRVVINESDVSILGANAVYADVTYKIKSADTILAIDENTVDEAVGNFNYKINITEYEKYINPQSLVEYAAIINKNTPADGDYAYTDLVDVYKKSDRVSANITMRECAAKALEAMLKEAEAEGYKRAYVFRGYVSRDFLAENAEDKEYTDKYGEMAYDEHLLGLSAEIYYKYRDVSFAETEAYTWLRQNAHKFGFVLRYPEGKSSYTGIEDRPWTFRFVGRYNAVKMYEDGLCLEEYVSKHLSAQ